MKYKILAEALRVRIERLPGGSRLPSLRSLQQRTGYSIQTINTAVGLLEREGALIRRHGSGLYVSGRDGTRHIAFCRTTFPSLNAQIKEQGLRQACARRSWVLTTHQFHSDLLLDEEVHGDGVVALPEIMNFGYSIGKTLIASPAPLIMLGEAPSTLDVDFVTGDDAAALSLILKRLVSLGHRRIVYLNTEPSCHEIDRKRDGFNNLTDVLDLDECPVIECHTRPGEATAEPAVRAMHECLSRHRGRLPFTALISCSSPGSLVAMRVLHEYGWRVPQDCSVICMQEDPSASYAIPALTNLKWNYLQWGEHCITLMEKRLNGEASSGQRQRIKIAPEFNWRESAAQAPANRSRNSARARGPSPLAARVPITPSP